MKILFNNWLVGASAGKIFLLFSFMYFSSDADKIMEQSNLLNISITTRRIILLLVAVQLVLLFIMSDESKPTNARKPPL